MPPPLYTTTANDLDLASGRWEEALAFIRKRIPGREYHTWFAPTRLLAANGEVARIQVPNKTFAGRLERQYCESILEALRTVGCDSRGVRCEVREDEGPTEGESANGKEGTRPPPRQVLDRGAPLAAFSSFDSFVVGASNHYAHAAAVAVSESGALEYSPYNPLLIYGDVGLGKTHLLQSIARRLLERNPDLRVCYTSGEAFTRNVVQAINTTNDLFRFREECAEHDVLLVDDLQFIAGLDRFGRSTEEFFHMLNALSERGRQVVITANAHPQDIRNLDTRIRSRLVSGLTTDVTHPDWATRVAIVGRKAATLNMDLPDSGAEKIASHFKSNVRELEGALARLIALSKADEVEISVALVDRMLTGRPRKPASRPAMHQVMSTTASEFGVPLVHLISRRRSQDVALARHVAMYLCRELSGGTLKEIGAEFRRDHATVTYALSRVRHQRERDPGLDRLVERLTRKLG